MTRLGRRAVVVAASGSGAVDSVNGATGVVTLDAGDVPFTPAGSIAATDVQAAIAEVAAEAGGGGITAAQANTALSAGGTDPITKLGIVAFKLATDDAITLVDDSIAQGTPAVSFRVVNPTNGDSWVEAGLSAAGWPSVVIKDGGAVVAEISETRIALGDPGAAYAWQVISGQMSMTDGASTRVQLFSDGSGLALVDTGVITRVAIKDDSTGVTLNDATGLKVGTLGEHQVLTVADGIQLGHEDAVAQLRSVVFLADTSIVNQLLDATGVLRAATATYDQGGGDFYWEATIWNDDATIQRGRIAVGADDINLALLDDTSGILSNLYLADQYSQLVFTLGGVTQFSIVEDGGFGGTGITINNPAGAAQQVITATTEGHFAATPYGQDAYIDPTTITPEQLGLAQIARGWMASS